jgi:hypothetical protein
MDMLVGDIYGGLDYSKVTVSIKCGNILKNF